MAVLEAFLNDSSLGMSFRQREKNLCGNGAFCGLLSHFVIFVLGMFSLYPAKTQAAAPEYNLKAVFLFNFVQFVDWPTNVFADEHSPIVIGILGANPFGQTLEETVRGEIVKGRKLEVRHYRAVQEIENCQVLFLSSSEEPKLDSILAALKGRSILTVGDVVNFAHRGGMVRFIKAENRIRFRVNVETAKAANLVISAKLLQLAEIVPDEKQP